MSPAAHHAQLADTELVNDPRGGWRFRDPADQAYFGADADQRRLDRPPDSNVVVPDNVDPQRLAFAGDAQFPPQSYPHSGTQGTWDDSLVPDADRPAAGAPRVADSEHESKATPGS